MDTPDLAGLRILAVDDEPDSLEFVEVTLSAAGATVYGASNGQKALEILEREKLDLVLADLIMPVMDGWELLKHIRAAGVDVPVIALTAVAATGDRERVLEAGFDDYLAKPLRMTKLVNALLPYAENRS